MSSFTNYLAGLTLAAFVALKVIGLSAWSWWWLLFPTVPVIAQLLGYGR